MFERFSRFAPVSVVVAVALSLVVGATAAPAAKTLAGSVGPGFVIKLTSQGKPVRHLKAGQYRVVVSDQADIHDFHLRGPGVDKVITSVGFTGTKTIVLELKKGTYTYVCDPHSTVMHGSFTVS